MPNLVLTHFVGVVYIMLPANAGKEVESCGSYGSRIGDQVGEAYGCCRINISVIEFRQMLLHLSLPEPDAVLQAIPPLECVRPLTDDPWEECIVDPGQVILVRQENDRLEEVEGSLAKSIGWDVSGERQKLTLGLSWRSKGTHAGM